MAAVCSLEQATPPPAGPSGQPARDRPGITSAGRGAIRGRVIDFNTGEGVPRAIVRIWGPGLFATLTRQDGSFKFGELAPGDYTASVTHNGYLDDDGTSQPGRRATSPITLGPNGASASIAVQLVRAGVIGGQITDEFGEPVAGVPMRIGRSLYVNGRRQLLSVTNMGREQVTDDEGRYRIGGLKPGRYFVWTMPFSDLHGETIVGEVPQSYLKTFAPGVYDVESASTIELGPGERNLTVNIALARGRPVAVSGMASGLDGNPLAGAGLSLDTFEIGLGYSTFGGSNNFTTTDAQGRF